MASGSVSTVIHRPPGDVFAVLADVRLNARWASASVSGELLTSGPVGVGTVAHEVSRLMGRTIDVRSEIVAFEADRTLTYVTSGGPFPFRGSFTTEPMDGGTRLTATFEAGLPGPWRLLDGVFGVIARRQLVHDLTSLKRLMEAGEL